MSRALIPGTVALAAFLAAELAAAPAQASTYTLLHAFDYSGCRTPAGGLVEWKGRLYGATYEGGAADAGCVYRLDPKTGDTTVVYEFTGEADGAHPAGEFVTANGLLYGVTSGGGASGAGTLYRVDPGTGVEVVLHDFGGGSDGSIPASGPVLVNGTFYGTTTSGGLASKGTVYAIDAASGEEQVLHDFAGGADGAEPLGPVTIVRGNLFGTTLWGGSSDAGTVFSIDPQTLSENVLHAFKAPRPTSANPTAGLVSSGTWLYGSTEHGGSKKACESDGCGTIFRVNAKGNGEDDLYRFDPQRDGMNPEYAMMLHDQFLYGTTTYGGKHFAGTIYSFDPATNVKTTLYDLTNESGANPVGVLVWYDGALIGATSGGADHPGTIFELVP